MSPIFLTHDTARRFWQLTTDPNRWKRSRRITWPRDTPTSPTRTSLDEAILALDKMGVMELGKPIDVLVDSDASRRHIPGITCHICKASLPENSFVRIAPGIFVASPELLFVQEAARLDFPNTVLLGFEFCGRYSVPPIRNLSLLEHQDQTAAEDFRNRGFFNRPPISSVERLSAFLAKTKRLHGKKNVLDAIPHILNESASPMESVCAMLLCLPVSRGGFGIEQPLLNARVDMKGKLAPLAAFGSYECDMLWPQANLAIEYDSELEHSGERRIAKDSRKRADLAAANISVITVTKQQVMGVASMEQIARKVAKLTGKRIRKGTFGLTDARIALRKAILWDRLNRLKHERWEEQRRLTGSAQHPAP